MGAVSISQLVGRVRDQILTLGTLTQLDLAWDVATGSSNARDLTFAVGVPRSVALSDRQRSGGTAYTLSTLRVAVWARLKPKASLVTYANALDVEDTVRKVVCARADSYPGDCTIRWVESARSVVGDEWHRLDLTFEVRHHQEN